MCAAVQTFGLKMLERCKKLLGFFVFYLRGGVAHARYMGVQVGASSRIYIRDFGSEPFLIKVGKHVTIASGVKLITHDGSGSLAIDERGRRYWYGEIVIEDNVFVGLNTIVLPGVTIGRNSIVAAGSVVSKDVPCGSVVAGVPAKVIDSFENWRNKALRTWPSEDLKVSSTGYESMVRSMLNSQKR